MLSWPVFAQERVVLCDYSCHLRRKSKAPGLDIAAPIFTLVLAAADGRVVRSRATERAGRSLWIDHGQGTRAFYSHLVVAVVLEGETVTRGQIVAIAGGPGNNPHLHFGLKFAGAWVDPGRLMV